MKIIVRHFIGSAGHFVAFLVHAMFHPTKFNIDNNGSAHNYNFIYASHNFDRIYNDPSLYSTAMSYTEPGLDPQNLVAVQWFKDHINFDSSDRHIIRTHSVNLDLLVPALGQCKIINLVVDELDLDQLVYNFVTKTIMTDNHWWQRQGYKLLASVQKYRPDLVNVITLDFIKDLTRTRDIEKICSVIKIFRNIGLKKFQDYCPEDKFDCFTIKWKDLKNINLIALADFVGADNVNFNLIKQSMDLYLSKQTPVPFKIPVFEATTL